MTAFLVYVFFVDLLFDNPAYSNIALAEIVFYLVFEHLPLAHHPHSCKTAFWWHCCVFCHLDSISFISSAVNS